MTSVVVAEIELCFIAIVFARRQQVDTLTQATKPTVAHSGHIMARRDRLSQFELENKQVIHKLRLSVEITRVDVYCNVPDSSAALLDIVDQFATYEDYLDSQLTETDLFYLEVYSRM